MPQVNSNILQKLQDGYLTTSENETINCAASLAPLIPENHTLALHGPLGTGKTTFVKGLAKAFGIQKTITSPTYTLLSNYQGDSIHLIHIDAYRLTPESDLSSLYLEDLLTPPYCIVIEWPENIPTLLPANAWHLYFSILKPGEHKLKLKP